MKIFLVDDNEYTLLRNNAFNKFEKNRMSPLRRERGFTGFFVMYR
jgi:hypothetical protein